MLISILKLYINFKKYLAYNIFNSTHPIIFIQKVQILSPIYNSTYHCCYMKINGNFLQRQISGKSNIFTYLFQLFLIKP